MLLNLLLRRVDQRLLQAAGGNRAYELWEGLPLMSTGCRGQREKVKCQAALSGGQGELGLLWLSSGVSWRVPLGVTWDVT
ncbi:unnamed protein product [Boreogadus saida]